MKLKIINVFFLGLFVVLGLSSCVKEDNYNGPDASLQGSVIQDGTDSTVQTCSGNFSIELEQLSWSSTPTPQYIPIKTDGTYENTQLFSGHYRLSLHGGAFWPIDSTEMDITQGSKHNFTVTPYMNITNFTAVLDDTVLKVNFHLDPPVDGFPKIIEMQAYTNTTQIVGPGASISVLSNGTIDDPSRYILKPTKDWSDYTDADKSPSITIPGFIRGRTFYVRVGVKFDDSFKSSNLSNIIEIKVPN